MNPQSIVHNPLEKRILAPFARGTALLGALALFAAAPSASADLTSTTTTANGYDIVTFTGGSGTWTPPDGVSSVEVLVVGGGGGGGANGGGGGGAGGVIHQTGVVVSPGVGVAVAVGAGGPPHPNDASNPTTGGDSVFDALTALGGGGGSSRDQGGQGANGGSGGGGGGADFSPGYLAGSGTPGQGNSGGNGVWPDQGVDSTGGGGGGAGSSGTAGASRQAGNGGAGVYFADFASVGGSPAGWFGGGGGGGRVANGNNGSGGSGGGGNANSPGVANTGGGGGAGSAGGSGVVIVRYPDAVLLAAKLAFTSVPANPIAGQPFTVTVQAQDTNGILEPVTSDTTVQLSVSSGSGTLGGTTSGTITNGTGSITIPGVIYSAGDTITLQAAVSAGMSLTAATANLTFSLGHLAFTLVPTSPRTGPPFSVTVQARDTSSLPLNVTSDTLVELSVNTGSGTLSGTTSGTIASGTSSVTIPGVIYSAADTMALSATETSGMSLTAGTSSPITFLPALSYSSVTNNGYDIVTFTGGSGTWTPPAGVTRVEVLVVGGGGGGGSNGGGGGGAGGLSHQTGVVVSPGVGVAVAVGAGGPPHPNDASNPTTGGDSVFDALTALGGGGGSSRDQGGQGANGGSGGGGGGADFSPGYLAGSGTPGQGNSGGNGVWPDQGVDSTGGGGGGAGSSGTAGASRQAGNGGAGVYFADFASVGGSPAGWFGGGGGGGRVANGNNGSGGSGGGGNANSPGVANTGGGGGAGSAGGSGVVIVRYAASGSGYSSWATDQGLTGTAGSALDPAFNADPNKDGIQNGMAWILGAGALGDPAANLLKLPSVSLDNTGAMILAFDRLATSAASATLVVQYGDDLGATPWTDFTVGTVEDTTSDGNISITVALAAGVTGTAYDRITVTIPATYMATHPKTFARLMATE